MNRKSIIRAYVLLGALATLLPMHGMAQNLYSPAALLKINNIESVWRVNADATSTVESYVEREALSDAGAQVIGKFSQIINQALQKFEVLEAYTLKANGRRIPVSKDSIQIQNGITAGNFGSSWPQAQVHQITFPDLQNGDKSVWRTRLTSHTPVLPMWAGFYEYVGPGVVFDKMSVRIEAPQSMGLNVFSSGWKSQTTQSAQNEVWQFEFQQPVAKLVEHNPTNTLISYPRILASTFKSHNHLAESYAREALAKAIVTDEIRTLSAKITEGRTTSFDKAAAIHDWVRKNIRYVAVYLGTGGWVPHDIDWILSKRYGDCKDHVLLMQTLLKAVDIDAVPALINTSNEYELPELPVGFNHSILYIPSLQLFADPTDSRIPFGSLPWADSDKPAAVALTDGAKVFRTPVFDSAFNRATVRTHLSISKDGKATGTIELDASGYAATELQDKVTQIPAGMSAVAIQKILESSRLRGRGFARYPAVQRDTQKQTFQIVDLEIDNLLPDPSGGSINPHPALNLPMYISNNIGNFTAAKRDYAFACSRLNLREEFELAFDPTYQILHIPANVTESHSDGIAFAAQYVRDGNVVKGWRELTASQPRHVCSVEQYVARRDVMNRISQHLRSTVLFQQ